MSSPLRQQWLTVHRAARRLAVPGTFAYEISAVESLDAAAHDELWQLYRRHFAAERVSLQMSLARAEHVIRLRRRDSGALCGMIACALREVTHQGRRFHVVWAGAGALDRECRGKWLLERAGLEILMRFWWRRPAAPIFFFGECNSFLSYRLLARSFAEYWPHPDRPTPPWERAVMDELARTALPDLWDPARRVLRPDRGKHIRPESLSTTAASSDPLLRFFQTINPGASLGEAIIMFAPVNGANLLALFTRKLLRRGRGERR